MGERDSDWKATAEHDGTLHLKTLHEGADGIVGPSTATARPFTAQHGQQDPTNDDRRGKEMNFKMSTVVDGIMAQDSMQAGIGSGEKIQNGSEGQNVTVDMAEGSGEYSPIVGSSACQTKSANGHIRVNSSEACLHDKMNDYTKNPPNMESASGKLVVPERLKALR
ncbi:hypothetical protein POUND7_007327 [Theobroma cacao]